MLYACDYPPHLPRRRVGSSTQPKRSTKPHTGTRRWGTRRSTSAAARRYACARCPRSGASRPRRTCMSSQPVRRPPEGRARAPSTAPRTSSPSRSLRRRRRRRIGLWWPIRRARVHPSLRRRQPQRLMQPQRLLQPQRRCSRRRGTRGGLPPSARSDQALAQLRRRCSRRRCSRGSHGGLPPSARSDQASAQLRHRYSRRRCSRGAHGGLPPLARSKVCVPAPPTTRCTRRSMRCLRTRPRTWTHGLRGRTHRQTCQASL